MRRVVVVGTSGAGKTHFARRLAEALSVPHIELDGLYNQEDWVPLPDEEFRARVLAAAAEESWVIDGNYGRFRDAVWPRADAVIFLDYDRWRVMLRLLRRTVRRVVWREELWNGNREQWGNLLSWRPEDSIVRWAWTTHARRRRQYADVLVGRKWSAIEFVKFSKPSEAERWLAQVVRE